MRKFEEIAAERFSLPLSAIQDSLTPKDVPEWDSMNYLLFISDLENTFDISLTMDEVLGSNSLGDIRRALQSKGIPV